MIRGAFRLLRLLQRYQTRYGRCFPSQEHIAQELGAGVRSVERWTAELKRVGAISVTHRGSTSREYVIRWSEEINWMQFRSLTEKNGGLKQTVEKSFENVKVGGSIGGTTGGTTGGSGRSVSISELPSEDELEVNHAAMEFAQAEKEAIERHVQACKLESSRELLGKLYRKARFYRVNGFAIAAAIERARRRVERSPSWKPEGPGWICAVVDNELSSLKGCGGPSHGAGRDGRMVQASGGRPAGTERYVGSNPTPAPAFTASLLAGANRFPRARSPEVDVRISKAVKAATAWRTMAAVG